MLFFSAIYFIIGVVIFASSQRQEDQFAGLIIFGIIAFVIIFSLIFIVPQIVGGWKILKEKPNARICGIIGSIMACLNFPLGTAAEVYGFWFLFGDEGKRFYENLQQMNYLGGMNAQSEFQHNANREYQPHNWR